ncbi:MAG: hypothetical protein NZM26_05035, partial [Patescibacteria group bacterium]|nr:hypothetical protein [Patescibacteria group bacterium]
SVYPLKYIRLYLGVNLKANIKFLQIATILFAGFFTALGGMLKDAPYEGFYPRKFFRSPFFSFLVGFSLLWLFPHIKGTVLLLCVFGGERIVSECYKKIVRGRIPGKFKTAKRNEAWRRLRVALLPIYAFNVMLFFLLMFI